ncbi:MAG: class I SAM-dependent methyltransferase [Sulfuritalea sp.]|nr:class I SAM-dependent methyltransferase [Sulfuritalea sp.]
MSCYLCNSSQFRYRDGEVRDDLSLKIVECLNCGLVSLSSSNHIQTGHYESGGMHGESPASLESWLRETESDDSRRFELLKGAMTNKRVLDFGCGAAGFLRKAQTVSVFAAGVEPENRVRAHWKEQIRIHEDLSAARTDGNFDLITAFHVIEHVPDPRAMLTQLADLLAESGRLVIEVPSADDALLTLYDSAAFQRFTYWSQHLFLFNPETMRQLASQAGLRVVAIRQMQRYPLSNHLHWLSKGKPGGHQQWAFLNTDALAEAYESALAALGKCDTIIAYLEKPDART